VLAAEQEGMSLNSFAVAAIARELGSREERERQATGSVGRAVAGAR
jgi:hypothetical protein